MAVEAYGVGVIAPTTRAGARINDLMSPREATLEIKCGIIYAEIENLPMKRCTERSNGGIISVQDKCRAFWQGIDCLVPACCHAVNFAIAIKLVAEEIREHGYTGRDDLHHLRYDCFVDFKDGDGSSFTAQVAGGKGAHDERVGNTTHQVGALTVVPDAQPCFTEDGRNKAAGGRFAVGTRDDHTAML